MNEETDPSVLTGSEANSENVDSETLVKNDSEDSLNFSEKNSGQNFEKVVCNEEENIYIKETFVSSNGVENKFLLPKELEEVNTSESNTETCLVQSELSLNEKNLYKLAQESDDLSVVTAEEVIEKCSETKEHTIKDTKPENNFSVLDDLQNSDNQMSNILKEIIDSANSNNDEKLVQEKEEKSVKQNIKIQGEKAECYNENLSINENKKNILDQTKESNITNENEKVPVFVKETYCEDKIKGNENDVSSYCNKDLTTVQNKEVPGLVDFVTAADSEEKILDNKNLFLNQNEEITENQSETSISFINEETKSLTEKENITQSKEIIFCNENSTKDHEKTNEARPNEAECEKMGEILKETETVNLEKISASISLNNTKEIDCAKNEASKNTTDLNKNKTSESHKQAESKEISTENQKNIFAETFVGNNSEVPKNAIQENSEILDLDLELRKTDNNKSIEQIQQSNLEIKSFSEHFSNNLDSNDTQKTSVCNNSSEINSKNVNLPNAETNILNVQNKEKNDSLQELINTQHNIDILNIGETEDEEDNSNKSENESTEVMDTEIVNCNEFESIDLNENEMQKEKEIDRIGVEPSDVDLRNEDKSEEMVNDSCEGIEKFNVIEGVEESKECSNIQDEPMIIDAQFDNPDDCENETITGDACNESAVNVKDKEEDICIIPDDGIPKVPILSQNKGKGIEEMNENVESEKFSAKKTKNPTPEFEKFRLRSEDKNSEIIEIKTRPLRNAAKLAGNKIKSLVLNDMVLDENSLSDSIKGEGDINVNNQEMRRECAQCKEVKVWKFLMVQGNSNKYLCSEQCSEAFAKGSQLEENFLENEISAGEFSRKCAQCHSQVTINDKSLFWETMDFCNEDCLGKYQAELGSNCANCKENVASISMGKYCVRFGSDVKQFCSANCLEEYKKGLKVCSYCQKDISTGVEGFLAPVGDKGQFKDFCTQFCMEKYERMCNSTPQPDIVEECAVCSNSKPVRVEVELDNKTHKLCSEPCFAAFKFVNNITEGQCDMCRKYFDRVKTKNFSICYDENMRSFCCKTCMNVYILANRKIVPCNWCKVKKYNFDMIKKVSASGQLLMMCSLNCLMLYQASVNAVCSRRVKCDFCMSVAQAQYHLTMSDASIRNFCSYTCVMSFQVMKKKMDFDNGEDCSNIILEFFAMRYKNNRYPKQTIDLISGPEQINSPTPTGGPKRVSSMRSQVDSSCVPVISSVQSLAPTNAPGIPSGRMPIPITDVNMMTQVTPLQQPLTIPTSVEIGNTTVAPISTAPPQIYQQIITKPPPAKQMKNKSILCKPYSHTKGVSCRPHPCLKDTQTDQSFNRKCLIPIPVPIYVPTPMHMFATPFPVPVPFPLPVPVPIFIPTTRNSAKGIFKEIKKIQEKIPTDPFEAELLMMAEMVAGEKKQDPTDSESEDGNESDDNGNETFSPENVDTSNTFGEDMLQMALKIASELEEPAVDMESVLTSNTITTTTQPPVDPNKALYDQVNVMSMNRGRKRSVRGSRNSTGGTPSKRGRRTSGSVDVPLLPPPEPVPPPRIEVEKPDANMCLKYTFGVNAWRHWVMQKNAELEKAAMTNRKIKLFKPELLQLTADELNFSLCLFVKEVRKPNGTEYAPDTIYYLCLGIQQYLFENGRIDNIFTDSYYEKFTDCLDEVAKNFATLYNDSQYIVTRVEEEHLWESKQLGAHSPHVLLSTLMFFNTKHFNLVTVEEHMQLSFSHIMKHWKRNPNTPGVAKVPGSRNVLLRFYPPQSALEANSRKKKVYEQQENEENPLRCPVKLYEFYLSKCPESVKTRNDVFYLLPERSCVPDSPVWYSTMALGKEPLMKMLHRVKMVKEINIALLSC